VNARTHRKTFFYCDWLGSPMDLFAAADRQERFSPYRKYTSEPFSAARAPSVSPLNSTMNSLLNLVTKQVLR
jgi:hypothetical protein